MMNTTVASPEMIISVIPANPAIVAGAKDKYKQLRVAAYCRVSTEQEEQQSSFNAQVGYYTEKISENTQWQLAGIFADEGISGTSVNKRPEFMRMIRLCEKGKIDMILTKSISRFSRNTVDCLNYIRRLKELQIPVVFEKENINTMQMASEVMLGMMGMFAQAESESLSKNVTWGIRNSFKNGNVPFRYNQMLGYEKGDDGKPKIVPEEAEVIKKIFKLYLDGSSLVQIKQMLESEHVKTASGKIECTQGGLKYILQNEKYVGDALLQKSYITDFISKKAKKNNGELPKYLVSNHHEAIIDRDTSNRVQEEMARRTSKRKVSDKTTTEQGRYSSKYALTELMMCGNCGSPYRRITWYRDGNKKVVWRCLNRIEHGTKYCKDSPSFEESLLHGAIVKALNSLSDDKNEIIPVLKYSLGIALQGKDEDGISIYTLEQRIKELNRCMMDMVVLSAKSGASEEKFDEEFKKISDEINALKELLKTNKCRQSKVENESSRLNEIFELIEKEDFSIKEYNDILTRQFIECIKVVSSSKLLVIFKGGMEMEVEV
jgi:site-specific DNA recombinase